MIRQIVLVIRRCVLLLQESAKKLFANNGKDANDADLLAFLVVMFCVVDFFQDELSLTLVDPSVVVV
jgi:hypothetical protein